MADDPAAQRRLSAHDLLALIQPGPGTHYAHHQVLRMALRNPEVGGGVVPLFTDPGLADRWIAEYAGRGVPLERTTIGSADAVTDLLSRLKGAGCTHVAYNPGHGPECPTVPVSIDRAILDIQLRG